MEVVLLLIVAGPLLWVVYDRESYELLGYRELYERKDWDGILAKAQKNRAQDLMVQFFTNCALAHKGMLLDQMFQYPQIWGPRGLVLNSSGIPVSSEAEDDTGRALYSSDLFLEMGHANAAFAQAYNHMVLVGRTYENLKRIVECNLVNGNYEIAEKYLDILGKTLFHRQFANQYKDMIADRDAVESCFGELRARLPTVDRPGTGEFGILSSLVESNPQNRMAFDYLTAWYLLDKTSLPMLAGGVGALRDAGYTAMPTHFQEALLMLETWRGTRVDTHGLTYDPETTSRYRGFWEEMESYVRKETTNEELRVAFGDTYMYYHFLITTPADERPRIPQ